MVVGSFSSNIYGIPRSTKDADFVIEAEGDAITRLAKEIGDGFLLDAQSSFETVTGTTAYRFTHRDSAFVIELFVLSADPHDAIRFSRRVRGSLDGHVIFVPTVEDVIVTKLRWSRHAHRQKDLDDVRGILAVQAGQLDLAYIRQWADTHGTRQFWKRCSSRQNRQTTGDNPCAAPTHLAAAGWGWPMVIRPM
jgi:hypothetical protein